jgi:hypothetical protein
MQDKSTGIIIKYFLHCPNSDISILVGLGVISANGLCPAFNPAQTRTSSNIILGLSSVIRVAPTSEPSRLLNLPAALVSLTNSRTASLKHLVNFFWTPPCLCALLPGYLIKSMPTRCTFEMQILSSSRQINLLPLLLPYKHLSMAQSALGFPLGIDGSGPIRTIRR